jgi:phage repressor protein C with HTH and peptisase S24 domain
MASTLADRLQARSRQLALSEVQIAERAGLTRDYVHDIWRGRSTRPNRARLEQIARVLKVEVDWLATGMGAVEGEPPDLTLDPEAFVRIPALEPPARAGRGKAVETVLPAAEPYQFRRSWILDHLQVDPEALRVMRIEGDSMQPTLQEGDAVLVNTARRQPSPPGIFILFDGMALVAKRLELTGDASQPRVRVRSDNPAYETYERPLDAISIIGRVRWFGRAV